MENKRQFLKVKEWFLRKTQDVSGGYNTFIDYERDESGMMKVEDGYAIVTVNSVLSESEKAVRVELSAGMVVGSGRKWTTWIPKSCMLLIE